MEWFIKNYSIFGTMLAPYSGPVKSPTCTPHKETRMKTPTIRMMRSLAPGSLIRFAAALLSACLAVLLLGNLLASGDWTLPMDATTAAIFTA